MLTIDFVMINLFYNISGGNKIRKATLKILIVSIIIASMMLIGTLTAFAADVDVTEDIGAAGDYKLASDISGNVTLTSGNYTIDLNGCTWTGSLTIQGATVTIIDSSAEKNGLITTDANDVIMVESGKLTTTEIHIEGNKDGCDGIFISGGTVIVKNCTISAQSSALQNKGGELTVKDGTYSSKHNALKVNNDSIITVNGAVLNGDLFIGDGNTTNNTIEKAFIPGSGYKLEISEKSEDGTKITKASFVKQTEETPSDPTPTPSIPDPQPNTGDATTLIFLTFTFLSVLVVLKKKKEA